jgi:predicted ATPase
MSEPGRSRREAARLVVHPGHGIHGRAEEVEALVAALDPTGARRVVVHGPLGVGTSTLVAEATERLGEAYDASVTLAVRGGPGMRRGLASHLGVLEPYDVDRLAAAVGGRRLLVVVDPPDGAGPHALLAERQLVHDADRLVDTCPGLAVVIIGRRPASWPGAEQVAVRAFDPPRQGDEPDALRRHPAVALLLDRVSLVDARLEPSDDVVRDAAEVCRGVGGLPLALELAAARAGRLGIDGVAGLLRGGSSRVSLLSMRRTEPRGVRTALELSYATLSADAQELLRDASTLRGPFDLDAACAVSDLPLPRLVDALDTLVDLHLASYVTGDDAALSATPATPAAVASGGAPPLHRARFSLDPVAAELAAELLDQTGEGGAVLDRHAAHHAALARRAALIAADAREPEAMTLLEPVAADLSAALTWLRAGPDHAAALRLAVDLSLLSRTVGERGNLRGVLDELLTELSIQPVDEGLLADAEIWSGTLALEGADALERVDEALPHILAGVDRARHTTDRLRLLRGLDVVARTMPLHRNAILTHRSVLEGLEVATQLGHERWVARFEAWRATLLHQGGDAAAAAELGLSALRHGRASGDRQSVVAAGILLHTLPPGVGPLGPRDASGRPSPEVPTLPELLEVATEAGDTTSRSLILGQLASRALAAGDIVGSARLTRTRLELIWRLSAWTTVAYSYLNASRMAAATGDLVAAARFHGIATPVLPVLLAGLPATKAMAYQRWVAALREELGADVFDRQAFEGSLIDAAAAHAEVLAYVTRIAGDESALSGRPGGPSVSTSRAATRGEVPLSAGEVGLLSELGSGRPLSEVADASGVGLAELTDDAAALYARLGLHGRAEAAAVAVRSGLV